MSDLIAPNPHSSDRPAAPNEKDAGPIGSDAGSSKCRFRRDTKSSDTMTLPDGRTLSYAEYGSPTGTPIFYCHGLPGCRLEAAIFHDAAIDLGARIISVERPGMGKSSPQPGRTLLDFPKDLQCLAEHLKLEEYRVLGISGGGPYALACAKAMPPDKLKCVATVCGLGPPDISMRNAAPTHKYGFRLGYRHFPSLAKWWFKRQTLARFDLTDEERLKMMLDEASKSEGKVHEKELKVMKDEDFLRLLLYTSRETFAQGFDGFAYDGKVMCVDWKFRLEDIRRDLPIHIWQGKFDVFVPRNHGEEMAARLGEKAHLWLEDETHGSITAYRHRDFLEALVKAA